MTAASGTEEIPFDETGRLEFEEPASLIALFEIGTARRMPGFADPGVIPNWDYVSLNLGAGNKGIGGSWELDLPSWNADRDRVPTADESVDVIYAIHVLEHVADPIRLLRECQRILKPGGVLNIVVPYWRSQGAFHDLDHKHFFTEDTWKNTFANPFYDKNHDDWQFMVGLNLIMGLNDRNMMLVTQLVKNPKGPPA